MLLNGVCLMKKALVVCNHIQMFSDIFLPADVSRRYAVKRKIPFVLDASQSAGVLDIDFSKIGAEFICMPGHKGLYGPQGTGLLLCSRRPESLIQGGTGSNSFSSEMPDLLPDRLEAGTHNMPGIAGLAAGIDFVERKGVKRILAHERELIDNAADGLFKIDRVHVFRSEFSYCQSGVLSFIAEGIPCETISEELSARGICVRTGLHCAPLAHKTVGTTATGTVRVSVSYFNTAREISVFLDAVEDIVHEKRALK